MSHRTHPHHSVSYYPAFLDLHGRPVVVIGGGDVAEQKTAGLLASGADVTVVAPDLTPTLTEWADTGRVAWTPRRYRNGDLDGAFVAFAATDRTDVNREVWQESERRRIPINAADDPPHCSFILPAVHRDGDLVVAISTGGKAPALAVRLRDRFATVLGGGYGEYLDLLASFRPRISHLFSTFAQRRDVWYRIVDSPAFERLREGNGEGARRLISSLIAESARIGRGKGAA